MRVLLPLVVLLSAASCVVVNEQCNPRTCNGCCTASGQCLDGNATNACGNGGNACSVCPGTFTCSLGTCQPGIGNGGGAGGGFGGGQGGGGGIGLAPGNIAFLWNFNAQTCAQTPAVQSVRVTIPARRWRTEASSRAPPAASTASSSSTSRAAATRTPSRDSAHRTWCSTEPAATSR